jgi:hypothetical protein
MKNMKIIITTQMMTVSGIWILGKNNLDTLGLSQKSSACF